MTPYILAAILRVATHDPGPPHWRPRWLDVPPAASVAIHVASILADIDPAYLAGVARAESSLRLHVTGDHGNAVGLFQLWWRPWRKVAPWLGPVPGSALQQGVAAGLVWRHLIRKVGRKNAARAYAAGRRWRHMTWITPPRWVAAMTDR